MRRAYRRGTSVLAAVGMAVLAGCQVVPIARGMEGEPPDGLGYPATISDDGRVIVYTSDATNLVPGDTNGVTDLFVLDRRSGRTRRVNVSSDGEQADADSLTVHRVSGNGRAVGFVSEAGNLVPGDTPGTEDFFVHDLRTGETELVGLLPDGSRPTSVVGNRGAILSDDARLVAFTAYGTDAGGRPVGGVFVRDRRTDVTRPLPGPPLPEGAVLGTFAGDGHVLVYLAPAEGGVVPVVRDLRTGGDDRILADHAFAYQYSIDIDDAGRTIAWGGRTWDGTYTGLLADRRTRRVEILATTTGGHSVIAVSSTGRYVTTFADAGPDVAGSAAVSVLDRRTGARRPVAVAYWTDIADDGRAVTLETAIQEGPFLWTAPRR